MMRLEQSLGLPAWVAVVVMNACSSASAPQVFTDAAPGTDAARPFDASARADVAQGEDAARTPHDSSVTHDSASTPDTGGSATVDASSCCTRDASYDGQCSGMGEPPQAFQCYCPQPGPTPPSSCVIHQGALIVCCP
jgi:hypothetical protein